MISSMIYGILRLRVAQPSRLTAIRETGRQGGQYDQARPLIARAVFAPMPGSRSIRSAIAVSWASVVMFSRSSTFQALSGRRRPRMGPAQSSKRPLCICFSSRFDDWLVREWARTARFSATRAACASLIRITVLVGKSGRRRGMAELRDTSGSARLPGSLTPVRHRSAFNYRCASMECITRTIR
jgi:hypothetical protein